MKGWCVEAKGVKYMPWPSVQAYIRQVKVVNRDKSVGKKREMKRFV